MKQLIHLLTILTLSLALLGCGPSTDDPAPTEISFIKTIDVLANGSPGLAGPYIGANVTGFVVGATLENNIPVTRYIGEIPRATLPKAGEELGACNDGTPHFVALDTNADRPINFTAKIIADTGGDDISDDRDCHCDSRIDEISISGFVVHFRDIEIPLQFSGFKISGDVLCPNIPDGHLLQGDREFDGAVDISGAIVLRIAPDGSTILADISLNMIEST